MTFTWDERKNKENKAKHGIGFEEAQDAFFDPYRLIISDDAHSTKEEARYFCLGLIDGDIATVRFTIRASTIRIFGAGYWRKGRKRYEQERKI